MTSRVSAAQATAGGGGEDPNKLPHMLRYDRDFHYTPAQSSQLSRKQRPRHRPHFQAALQAREQAATSTGTGLAVVVPRQKSISDGEMSDVDYEKGKEFSEEEEDSEDVAASIE